MPDEAALRAWAKWNRTVSLFRQDAGDVRFIEALKPRPDADAPTIMHAEAKLWMAYVTKIDYAAFVELERKDEP